MLVESQSYFGSVGAARSLLGILLNTLVLLIFDIIKYSDQWNYNISLMRQATTLQ